MSVVPIRPVFQDGQRLTAERLTQALEFLRTMLRRVLLAPLSSGVAGGFELTPTEASGPSGVLTVAPGLAIDGQGRLIVVPDTLTFSLADIVAGSGLAPAANKIVRVCLAQKENVDSGPCSPFAALGVEEGYEVLFREQDLNTALLDVLNSYQDPNSVPAWGDLDPPYATPEDSCVTLGHLVFADTTTFYATDFYRDGVSPRFTAIRNTAGTPSILLNELNLPVTPLNPSGKAAGMAVPVAAVFGPKPVIVQPGAGMAVLGPAYFKSLVGESVQATHVAPYGEPYSAGGTWSEDQRVFVFPGGAGDYNDVAKTSEIPAGLGGVSAVPCEVSSGSDLIDRAGIPLAMTSLDPSSGKVQVESTVVTDQRVVGLSGGKETSGGTQRVVPVAAAGLLKVRVEHSGIVLIGDRLTSSTTPGVLKPAMTGEYAVAKAAQSVSGPAATTEMFAWAITPSMVV